MNEEHSTFVLTLAQRLKAHATTLSVRRRILKMAHTFIAFSMLDLEHIYQTTRPPPPRGACQVPPGRCDIPR